MDRLISPLRPRWGWFQDRARDVTRRVWRVWRAIVNRCRGPEVEAGLVLGSSRLSLRLRGVGRPLDQGNCIAIDDSGKLLATGDLAAALEGKVPPSISVTWPVRGGRIDDIRDCRRLLEAFMRSSRHGVLGGPSLVVAVSSEMTPIERRTVNEVALAAGARSVYLVDQSLLLGLGAGLPVLEPEGRMVVDLGAGKVEISLLSMGDPVRVRSLACAGQRMDRAIQDYLRQEHHLLVGAHTAEELKKSLGGAQPRPEPLDATAAGRDLASGLPARVRVSSRDIEAVLAPLVGEVAEEIKAMVKELPVQLACDVASTGMLLAGGGARLWGMAEFLAQETGLEVRLPDQPEELMASGLQRLLREPALRKQLLSRDRSRRALPAPRSRPIARGAAVLVLALTLWVGLGSFAQPVGLVGLSNTFNSVLTPIWRLASPDRPALTSAAAGAELRRRLSLLRAENARLRRIAHGPDGAPAWTRGSVRTARVVARSPRSWGQAVVIDAGAKNGVTPGCVVVSTHGLVGRVSGVATTSSQVTLSRAVGAVTGGRVVRTRTAGVLFGRGLRGYRMRYLDPDGGVRVGDRVFTSGLDGHYPAGILVGRIVSLSRPSGELYLSADVRPSLDLDRLDEVAVLERHPR